MTGLPDLLLDSDRRPKAVAALTEVVDAEVKDKKGVSAVAIKAAYATVRKVSPQLTARAIDKMLPDFAAALDPYWTEFGGADGAGDFGAFLSARSDQVTPALLAVTDRRAEASSREMVKKAYRGIRGKAQENVAAALPRVGATIAAQCR